MIAGLAVIDGASRCILEHPVIMSAQGVKMLTQVYIMRSDTEGRSYLSFRLSMRVF